MTLFHSLALLLSFAHVRFCLYLNLCVDWNVCVCVCVCVCVLCVYRVTVTWHYLARARVSFAKEPYKRVFILQKRPIIRHYLARALPLSLACARAVSLSLSPYYCVSVCVCVCVCVGVCVCACTGRL